MSVHLRFCIIDASSTRRSRASHHTISTRTRHGRPSRCEFSTRAQHPTNLTPAAEAPPHREHVPSTPPSTPCGAHSQYGSRGTGSGVDGSRPIDRLSEALPRRVRRAQPAHRARAREGNGGNIAWARRTESADEGAAASPPRGAPRVARTGGDVFTPLPLCLHRLSSDEGTQPASMRRIRGSL